MYVPKYLELLDRSGTIDGWPKGIDEAAKTFAIDQVKAGLVKYGPLSLDLAYRCIYDGYTTKDPVPLCLKAALWDFLYAVTYRAILGAGADVKYTGKQETGQKSICQVSPKRWVVIQDQGGTWKAVTEPTDKTTAERYLKGDPVLKPTGNA